MGHDAGDQLLQEVAARLTRTLRAVDVTARPGGDEFVILIEEVSDLSHVAIVAHKILNSIIKPLTITGQECRIMTSIGISVYPEDAEDKAITEAIIAMGRTLSLTVVAEGVETVEQMNFLKEHSCDEMQGYYFSKPIVPEQFADLLRKHLPSPRIESEQHSFIGDEDSSYP
jgi:predicted signal transduction protein with EAL and GGDEF domain